MSDATDSLGDEQLLAALTACNEVVTRYETAWLRVLAHDSGTNEAAKDIAREAWNANSGPFGRSLRKAIAALRAREGRAVQKCNLCGDTVVAPAGAGEAGGQQTWQGRVRRA